MLKLINYTLSGGKKWGRGFLFMRIKALTTPFAVSYTSKNIVLSGARGNVVDNIVDNIVVTHARMTPLSGLRMDTEPETLGVDGEAPVEASNASPLVQRTRQLLYRRMKVEITDGRLMIGNFHCLDKQGNLLLVNTVEHRRKKGSETDDGEQIVEQRNLGLVLIPHEHRVQAHMELSAGEDEDPAFLDPDAILKRGTLVYTSEMGAS